jgi:polysaccharide biosynthesis transport protein
MSLRDVLLVLRSRWQIVAAATLLVLMAAAVVLASTTPVYEANAKFYLAAQDTTRGSESQGTYVVTTTDLNTYVAVLQSPAVMEPLREELGLPPRTPIDVSAEVEGDASILSVTARSEDPQRAAEIANAVGPQLAAVADQFSVLLQANSQKVAATTVSPAGAPDSPVSPNIPRGLMLGLLAGLCVGVGLAFVRHTLDTKVRTDADVRAMSDSPILAALPIEHRETTAGLHMEAERHGPYAEAIRRLRTNLLFVDVTTGTHSFVVTSAMPAEGKTTTAVNLALAMTHTGARVLLVDADLRNPSVASTLGLEGSVGLTTVLLGKASVDDVVQPYRDTGLFVLAAGQVPPNPSELLGSEPMQSLFAKLTQEFDFVLVDSPPIVPVIDAVLIEKLTGGMLMVVGANRTRKRDLTNALKSLETVGARVSGFAWNFVFTSKYESHRYGYYRYGKKTTAQPGLEPASERPAPQEQPGVDGDSGASKAQPEQEPEPASGGSGGPVAAEQAGVDDDSGAPNAQPPPELASQGSAPQQQPGVDERVE